jgi:hypothetical protein
MDPAILGYLMLVAVNNGLPVLSNILQEWKKQDPTMTDLEVLKSIPIDPDAS